MWKYVGVDLHKNQFTVCFMDEEEHVKMERYGLNPSALKQFKATLHPEMEIAVEATLNSAYFYDEVVGCVKKVRVVNPSQFKVISESVKKTDRHDAIILARYLKKGLLPEVRMRTKEERELKSLIQTRDKLVKVRSLLKNKVHSILNAAGIVTPKKMLTSAKGLARVKQMKVGQTSEFEIQILTDQIQHLTQSIKALEAKITAFGQSLTGHKNLQSIKGIGALSATILLANIGDIKDFASSKQLCAYAGIVPSVKDTNETVRHGRITKRGNKLFRTTLVQSTWVAIRFNSYLKRFYTRLKQKKGKGKAIIATSRKLLDIIYNTLKNNWVFKDFDNFELVTQT